MGKGGIKVIALDLFWMTDDTWYDIIEREDGSSFSRIKDNAPSEAKNSYKRYIEQINKAAEIEKKTGYHVI